MIDTEVTNMFLNLKDILNIEINQMIGSQLIWLVAIVVITLIVTILITQTKKGLKKDL